MPPQVVINLPQFDTGQYEDCEFRMVRGNATLTLLLAELPLFNIEFRRVRWHRYTQLHNCEIAWIESAYFRLIEVPAKDMLAQFIANDSSTPKSYKELHHYRIFLDETGCHEVFAESAVAL